MADTAIKFRQIHLAKCSACGHVAAYNIDCNFIRLSFLPHMCEGCGSSMAGNNTYQRSRPTEPHWKHVILKERLDRPPRTWNPLTWLSVSRWSECDRREYPAT